MRARLVLDAGQAAEGLHLSVALEGVAEALHERRLDARHGRQLRQLIQLEVAHAWFGSQSRHSRCTHLAPCADSMHGKAAPCTFPVSLPHHVPLLHVCAPGSAAGTRCSRELQEGVRRP